MHNHTEQYAEQLSRERKKAILVLQVVAWIGGFGLGVIVAVLCLRGLRWMSLALLILIALSVGALSYLVALRTTHHAGRLEDIGHTRGRFFRENAEKLKA